MLNIPLGSLEFNDDVVFLFPSQACCNCGSKEDLKTIKQDTRRTSYMLLGGTEQVFSLPLPFCARCAVTAKRRPKNWLHRVLMFLLAFGGSALALIVVGDLVLDSRFIAQNLVPLALSFAAGVSLLWWLVGRPKSPQTSYFQPVRIPKLSREFVSGRVTSIGFAFSNADYARAFTATNRRAIEHKVLSVEKF